MPRRHGEKGMNALGVGTVEVRVAPKTLVHCQRGHRRLAALLLLGRERRERRSLLEPHYFGKMVEVRHPLPQPLRGLSRGPESNQNPKRSVTRTDLISCCVGGWWSEPAEAGVPGDNAGTLERQQRQAQGSIGGGLIPSLAHVYDYRSVPGTLGLVNSDFVNSHTFFFNLTHPSPWSSLVLYGYCCKFALELVNAVRCCCALCCVLY